MYYLYQDLEQNTNRHFMFFKIFIPTSKYYSIIIEFSIRPKEKGMCTSPKYYIEFALRIDDNTLLISNLNSNKIK